MSGVNDTDIVNRHEPMSEDDDYTGSKYLGDIISGYS